MNAIDSMNANVSSFSKTDRRIYEAIRKFPESFASQSITEISESAGFTKPALTRFAKRVGFSGFAEFQYQFAQDLEETKSSEQLSNAEVYGKLLKTVDEAISGELIEALVERIFAARCVYLYGSNLSALPAEELYISLQFEKPVISVLPQLDTMPAFAPDDLVIIYSAARGDSHRQLLNYLRRDDVVSPYLLLVTTNGKHSLRHRFDETIVLPTTPLAAGRHSILADTFSFLMFNDRLSAALAERR